MGKGKTKQGQVRSKMIHGREQGADVIYSCVRIVSSANAARSAAPSIHPMPAPTAARPATGAVRPRGARKVPGGRSEGRDASRCSEGG